MMAGVCCPGSTLRASKFRSAGSRARICFSNHLPHHQGKLRLPQMGRKLPREATYMQSLCRQIPHRRPQIL